LVRLYAIWREATLKALHNFVALVSFGFSLILVRLVVKESGDVTITLSFVTQETR